MTTEYLSVKQVAERLGIMQDALLSLNMPTPGCDHWPYTRLAPRDHRRMELQPLRPRRRRRPAAQENNPGGRWSRSAQVIRCCRPAFLLYAKRPGVDDEIRTAFAGNRGPRPSAEASTHA